MKTSPTSAVPSAPEPSRPGPGAPSSALDWARESGEAERVVRELEVYLVRRRRRRWRTATAGVALAALIVVAWPAFRGPARVEAEPVSVAAGAAVRRPETRALPDGSQVELKAGAELEVDFSGPQRRVVLRSGEAHFQVAKDAQRTFVVMAGGVEVRAVGTAFSVDVAPEAIEVLVTEGRVAVENMARPQPTAAAAAGGSRPTVEPAPVFGAGNLIRVDVSPAGAEEAGPRAVTVSEEEMERQLAWRVPRLEFSGTMLAQALPMFNAYGRVRMVLADPALGRLQLSGVLRADDTDSLLRLLEGEFGLAGERRGDELVLRRR